MDEQTPVDESLGGRQSPPSPAAQDDASPVSHLTPEARALVEQAMQGGVPLYTTANLARIAEENGVSVSAEMTPNHIIDALRRRSRPGDA
jgi:hypothetical protein